MDDEEFEGTTKSPTESIPLEVKIINKDKLARTPYDSIDSEIEDMYLDKEEIEEFENGT